MSETVKLNCVLHFPEVAHILVAVSGLCDDGHTVTLTKKDCVFGAGKRTGRLYAIRLTNNTDNKAPTPP